MSNERDAAVERVLNDLRVLLTRSAETGCPCGRAERYTVPQGEVLAEARAFSAGDLERRQTVRFARAKAHLEAAAVGLDRAIEQLDLIEQHG